jgi:DNA invertase Pin-like site-specific DNA recombinase
MGPYDGLVAPSVDRIGRNVRDALNTQVLLTSQGRMVVTADHVGVWDFSDPNQENDWLFKALGSQLELRTIQKRNRDETIRAREAGDPKQRPSDRHGQDPAPADAVPARPAHRLPHTNQARPHTPL